MTKEELSRIFTLKNEVRLQKEKLRRLQKKFWPDGGNQEPAQWRGTKSSGGQADNPIVLAEELRLSIRNSINAYLKEINRLEGYISSVEDSEMRQLLSLRYIDGCTWPQVAYRMGDYRTADCMRMKHNRFLKT